MRRGTTAMIVLLLVTFLGASTSAGFGSPSTGSLTYYAIELRGGSHLYAADRPVRRGKVLLFHRYPDGGYVSLPSSEVASVGALEAPPAERAKDADSLAPGQTLYVGGALEGPRHELPPAPVDVTISAPDSGYGYGYGYGDWGYWGGGGYVPSRPGPVPPSHIGPNGFPIIAPPGSPGSVPNPIGSNGFPILAPSPVAVPAPPIVAPRRR
jgi:hypothetical protein